MNDKILNFMDKQKVASVCCNDQEGHPYCFSCFFVFDPVNNLICFKSSSSAFHTGLLQENTRIAGTILPDKLNLLAIKGIQFSGTVLSREDPLAVNATKTYHKKLPYALAMSGEVTAVLLDSIKMTDNSAGFGKKITWIRESTQMVEGIPQSR